MESKVEDIRWSKRSYTLREAFQFCSSPQLMKVSWVGEIPSDENETVAKNRILRIHQTHIQTRVLASIKKNKWLSVPLRYADARFEIITNKKRSKPMYMRDVIDRVILPQEATFYLEDELQFDLQTAKGSVSERLSPLLLRNMYEVFYLQGNAIYNNHLDTQVVNIPLYLPVKVLIAEGFIKHTADNWRRYQALLSKLVSRHVTFELSPGIQNITFFSDKRLEKAESQEDYEKIPPIGTLYVTSARERLRSKATTAGVSGSRTVAHTSAPPPKGSQTIARAPASGATTKNGAVGKSKQMAKSSSAATIMSSDSKKAQFARNAQDYPGVNSRSLSPNIATMPARAVQQRNGPRYDPGNANAALQPPPVPSTARPVKTNHVGNAVTEVDGSAPRGRENRPSPLTTTGRRYRRRSPSIDATPASVTGALRRRSPSVGSMPEQVLVSQTGRVRKAPDTSTSPGIIARTPGSASSADSDYEHLKASLPVHIPAPDYDPNESIFQFPMEDSKAQEAGYGVPPTPPPVSSIPKTNRQTSMPPAVAPAPSSVLSAVSTSSFSSTASSAASTPTAVAPPPPPQPPPAPLPPGSQGPGVPPPPPPPPPPALDWKPPGARVEPAPVIKPQPKAIVKAESTMSSMMEELKKAQQRRMSRGTDLEDAIDASNQNSSPRVNVFAKPQASPPTNELQSILLGRRTASDQPQASTNRLPVAPRPKPGGFRATNANTNNATFTKVEDIPSQLKGLTVAQISQCLRLLNLEKYVEKFKKNCIDGDLMMSLNKDMLRGDLGLTEFDMQKVLKFIQGWRPK